MYGSHRPEPDEVEQLLRNAELRDELERYFDESITRLRKLDVHEPSSREFVSETADEASGVGADVFL